MKEPKSLTKKQEEIKQLYYDERMTMEQIASRLKISRAGVHYHVQAINKKLHLKSGKKRNYLQYLTSKESGGYNPGEGFKNVLVRIHGLHFVVIPYWMSDLYRRLYETKENVIPSFHGWRVELNRENIEIISLEETSFYGKDRYEALDGAFNELNKTIIRLENRLKIGIIKPDKMNMKMTKIHIATLRDGVATSVQDDRTIMLFNKEGQAWFAWDQSKDEPEWEAIHSMTAKMDYDTLQTYFGDFKENKPPTNTELLRLLAQMALGIAAPKIQEQENIKALEAERIYFRKDYIG